MLCGLCGGHRYDQRWSVSGSDLTPSAQPSYLVRTEIGGKSVVCHTYLNNGVLDYLNDCTGGYAGKKVRLEAGDIFYP